MICSTSQAASEDLNKFEESWTITKELFDKLNERVKNVNHHVQRQISDSVVYNLIPSLGVRYCRSIYEVGNM